jgi:uncharacterized protein YjbI with pentapeptide repeats
MSPEVTAAWIAAGVSFATLVGTLAAQYLSRRATKGDLKEQRDQLDRTLEEQSKQLDRTLAEQRTRTLNERFATAAGQLGSDKPPEVRLAGVYAMAGLADDWGEDRQNRQTCVDVLCAYLRMPYKPDPGQDAPEPERLAFRASREVRHTVIRVIAAHLKDDAKPSWQGLNFDFTGAVFDGGDFRGAEFPSGQAGFDDAEFVSGEVRFDGAKFSGAKVYFGDARFSGGKIRFDDAEFSGGTVSFRRAEFSGAEVEFQRARFSGSSVNFAYAKFSSGKISFFAAKFSGSSVEFGFAEFSGGTVTFDHAKFSHRMVGFDGAYFSGGEVSFSGAEFSGGTVGFKIAKFSGADVQFQRAEFSGGLVDFNGARFSGGTVDFSDSRNWSFPPAFPWTDTPPPGVKLPEKEDQSQR